MLKQYTERLGSRAAQIQLHRDWVEQNVYGVRLDCA